MPTGIDLIRADHKRVNALFREHSQRGDGVAVGMILDALTAHDEAEHAALYPFAAALGVGAAVMHRLELAHQQVKALMDEVRACEGAALADAVKRLRTAVTEHVRDEETTLLPALSKKATADQLATLAARIEQNKQRVG